MVHQRKHNLKIKILPFQKACQFRKPQFYRLIAWLKREGAKFTLHPCLQTFDSRKPTTIS